MYSLTWNSSDAWGCPVLISITVHPFDGLTEMTSGLPMLMEPVRELVVSKQFSPSMVTLFPILLSCPTVSCIVVVCRMFRLAEPTLPFLPLPCPSC